MLTLEIKDNQLNTAENFAVQIEDQNPATKFDEIVAGKAIGIELPIDDTNRIYLQNPERFEKMGSINDRRFDNAVLRHFGQIVQKGTLIIDGANKTYSGWLRDLVGNLAEKVAGKFINQSTLGGEKIFENKITYDPEIDDYACPKIFNRHFWRDRGKRSFRTVVAKDIEGNEYNTEEEDGELTWQFFENEQFFVNFPVAGGVKDDGVKTSPVVSPMLFLWRAVELILSDYYIYVKENFLKDDNDLKKLIIYNNYNIAAHQIIYTGIEIHFSVYTENNPVLAPVQEITTVISSAGSFRYSDLLPKISMGKLILGAQNLLNVIFSFNDLNECRIVDRQKLLTETAFDVDEYMVGEWDPKTRKNVTVKLSMQHDLQDYAFSDNWQDLSDIRGNIEEPVQQRTDLDALNPEMDEIRLVIAENRYYQYHWYVITTINNKKTEEQKDILGWEMITIGFQPYFFNDGDKEVEEIETCFSTLRQSDNGYPLVMQKGNAGMFKTQPEAFTPRLLFYEGGEFASFRTNNLSLDFHGETGLAKKRWNYWLPFWANRLPASATFKFPASIFYYIKNNKAILPLRTRHGSFIIDRLEATASRADTIETTLYVFKRESIAGFEQGNVPGSGEGTSDNFAPVYLGITSTGKPYLVNANGDVRIPPAWGTLSPASFSKTVCIDYDPMNKLLFVGGYNGMLYITNLTSVGNQTMKSIQVFASGNVSAVRYLNGNILIGKDASNKVYVQPHFADFGSYASGQATEGTINGYIARDFIFHEGYYYTCTQAGEVHRTTTPAGTWQEMFDVKADFRKMVESDNKLMVFGKEEGKNDDRNFSAAKSNLTAWNEFDIESSSGIYVNEAISIGSDQVLITTNKEFGGAKIVNPNNSTTYLTPSLAKLCGGAASIGGNVVIAIQEGTGATKLAINNAGWSYINVPAFFSKLFGY